MSATSTILSRFSALASTKGWEEESKTYKRRRRAFIVSEVKRGFDAHFGAGDDLQAWKLVCETIDGIEGAEGFTSIKACKTALKGKYVNIVDLVDALNANRTCQSFASQKKLREYIKENGKIFPKKQAKASPMLSTFLIVIGW